MRNARLRLFAELILGVAATGVTLLTAISPNWTEIAFRADPDNGSGALEWAAAGALMLLLIGFASAPRLTFRALSPQESAAPAEPPAPQKRRARLRASGDEGTARSRV